MLHSPSPTAPRPRPAGTSSVEGAPAADDAAIEDLLSALDLAESDRSRRQLGAGSGRARPAGRRRSTSRRRPARSRCSSARVGCDGAGRLRARGRGRAVRVIGRRVLDLVDREPAAFRDRRLFPLDPHAVTSIAWRDEGGADELTAVDGRWQNGRKEWVDERPRRGGAAAAVRAAHRPLRRPPRGSGDPRTLTMAAGTTRVAVEAGRAATFVRGAEARARSGGRAWRRPGGRWRRRRRATRAWSRCRPTRSRASISTTTTAASASVASVAPGRSRRRSSPYAADTRVVDEWLARLGAIKAATRCGRRERAPPDRRGPLSPADRRFLPARRLTRCSRPIRSASASATCCRSRASTCAGCSAAPARHAGGTRRAGRQRTWRASSGEPRRRQRGAGRRRAVRPARRGVHRRAASGRARGAAGGRRPAAGRAAAHPPRRRALDAAERLRRAPGRGRRRSSRSARPARRSAWTCWRD